MKCPHCGGTVAELGGMTVRQQQVYQFIASYIKDHDGVSPNYEEIMEACGFQSKHPVNWVLNKLKERGLLTWRPAAARSITILGADA